MLRPFIRRLAAGESLDRAGAEEAMSLIMEGMATPAQIGAFVVALRMKGESVEEVTGCATAMRARAAGVHFPTERLLDTCGTGGDAARTFNISTAAAFVAAAGGAVVAKHGNRAVSSQCGSADVMEALGVSLHLSPGGVEACLREAGIGFLFAPDHHAAMRHAAAPRREIGIRTVFNILGPLSNPAGARRQLMGVYAPELAPLMARVLAELGSERALVVHGRDGLDEVSLSGRTLVSELVEGVVRSYEIDPGEFGLTPAPAAAIAGGTAAENAALIRGIFERRIAGAPRDIVVLNAGAALQAAGLAEELREGIVLARQAIDSGAALDRLERLVRASKAHERPEA